MCKRAGPSRIEKRCRISKQSSSKPTPETSTGLVPTILTQVIGVHASHRPVAQSLQYFHGTSWQASRTKRSSAKRQKRDGSEARREQKIFCYERSRFSQRACVQLHGAANIRFAVALLLLRRLCIR